jgi:hypothetical protein
MIALIERRNALTGSSRQSTEVGVRESAPQDIALYPPLPENKRFDHIDSQQWFKALPCLHALGISSRQASGLIELLAVSNREGLAEHEREANQKLADNSEHAHQWLERTYGHNYKAKLSEANETLRFGSRRFVNAKIGTWKLANGELLGNRPEFISLLIELGAGQ